MSRTYCTPHKFTLISSWQLFLGLGNYSLHGPVVSAWVVFMVHQYFHRGFHFFPSRFYISLLMNHLVSTLLWLTARKASESPKKKSNSSALMLTRFLNSTYLPSVCVWGARAKRKQNNIAYSKGDLFSVKLCVCGKSNTWTLFVQTLGPDKKHIESSAQD